MPGHHINLFYLFKELIIFKFEESFFEQVLSINQAYWISWEFIFV